MTQFDSGRKNGHDSIELEPRTRRALQRPASVLHTDGTPVEAGDKPTIVVVISGNSGREHTVDVREQRCTCEDHKHRSVGCWHLRRAAIALGDRVLDARELEAADIDSTLAANAPGPAIATSDGGIIEADDDGEILNERDDGRPEDCDCGGWNADAELPCWPCYRDGFDRPASADDE